MASLYSIKNLSEDGKSRYLDKLQLCGLSGCPYQLPADTWINDPTQWPDLEWPEVYDYLINTPGVYTREAMKNRKSLEGHNQFTSGWVRTVLHFRVPKTPVLIMKADVMPSQRLNDAVHMPWIAVNSSTANVITAHCSCMAGLGESCSHIGALLFKVEAAIRMGYTKLACTDEACKWNNDFVKKVKGERINKIQFYTSKAVSGLKRKGPTLTSTDQKIQTEEEKADILHQFSSLKSKPVVLHSFSDHCDSFTPTYIPPARAKIPPKLRSLFNSSNLNSDLEKLSLETLDGMVMSPETIKYIFDLTRKQSKSQVWHDMRCGRVTASIAHGIMHTDMENPSKSLIKNICADSKFYTTSVPSLKWGLDHEKVALSEFQTYASVDHVDYQIEECGLLISAKYPFLGASADGIFSCKCHNVKCVIEIKCPYSLRDTSSVEEVITSGTDFCIDKDKQLKRNHRYFSQVQMQMFVHDVQLCKFFVWTPNWSLCIDIFLDDKFTKSMVTTVKEFYSRYVIPELLTRKIENEHSTKDKPIPPLTATPPLYCFCNSEHSESETWIRCDAVDCARKWFHLTCVKRKRIPKGKWYCKVCRGKKGGVK